MSVLAGTQVQDTLLVTGGVPLSGEVQAGGSKNAALPLLAAAALPAGGTGLDNVPACADVQAMSGLLTEAGWPVQAGDSPGHVRVGAVAPGLTQPVLSGASRIRASYYLVPALLAAYGQASLPWPGGCSVGERGMDLHFTVYEAFGDTAQTSPAGYVIRAAAGARGTVRVALPFRSRGATVAALLRGVSAGRPVVIGNPNLSAELYAVYRALEAAGCAVEVTGQAVTMEPGDPASPVRWRVPGDKIEAGTLACAIAATGGSGQVPGCPAGRSRAAGRGTERARHPSCRHCRGRRDAGDTV